MTSSGDGGADNRTNKAEINLPITNRESAARHSPFCLRVSPAATFHRLSARPITAAPVAASSDRRLESDRTVADSVAPPFSLRRIVWPAAVRIGSGLSSLKIDFAVVAAADSVPAVSDFETVAGLEKNFDFASVVAADRSSIARLAGLAAVADPDFGFCPVSTGFAAAVAF